MRFRGKMDLQCPGMASSFTVPVAMTLTTIPRVVHLRRQASGQNNK
jgi:hypothetical protein